MKESAGAELSGESLQFLEFIDQSVVRMQQLIDSLLQLSRIGRSKTEFTKVDVRECIDAALENLSAQIEQRGCHIEIADDMPVIYGNESQLVQVFQNLISNAAKFSRKEDGAIEILSAIDGDQAVISIKDNGIGIEEEFIERVFVPFQRLHSREEYEGSGIGLSIVRKIVELHKGSIEVQSKKGEGSTFSVRFKLWKEANS